MPPWQPNHQTHTMSDHLRDALCQIVSLSGQAPTLPSLAELRTCSPAYVEHLHSQAARQNQVVSNNLQIIHSLASALLKASL